MEGAKVEAATDTTVVDKNAKRVKLQKPDKADLDQKLEGLQNDINAKEDEVKEIKNKLDKISNDRSGSRVLLFYSSRIYSNAHF